MLCILRGVEHALVQEMLQKQDQQTDEDVERLFYSSIASPYTRRTFRIYLQKYLAFYGMKNVSELLSPTKDHKEIERQIINFIIESKEKGMKRIAISNYTCPVISFCKINDIMLNTAKINKFMPPQVKSKKTYGYTHEQIAKLLEIADERMRLVVLLASSAVLALVLFLRCQLVHVKSTRICIRLPFMRTKPRSTLSLVLQN